MKLSECNFRELYRQCVIINGKRAFDTAPKMLEDYSYKLPAKVDSVLCYCYIDAQAGMSFDFLCLAYFDNGEPDFKSYEKLLAEKIRLFYRYGAVQDDNTKFFSQDVSIFNKRCTMIDEGYHRDEKVLPTRNIKAIDHLRYIQNPDDISVLLRKDGLQVEQVWIRLSGIENGNLSGVLLNEPNSDFGVHMNDLVHVQVTTKGNDVYALCLLPNEKQGRI